VYGDDQYADLSVTFQNAMPIDTQPISDVLSSPNSLSNFSKFALSVGFISGIRDLIDAEFYGSFNPCEVKHLT